jgi:hypothetical protein
LAAIGAGSAEPAAMAGAAVTNRIPAAATATGQARSVRETTGLFIFGSFVSRKPISLSQA